MLRISRSSFARVQLGFTTLWNALADDNGVSSIYSELGTNSAALDILKNPTSPLRLTRKGGYLEAHTPTGRLLLQAELTND